MTESPTRPEASPLYYATLCGFPSLVEHLAITHPADVNAKGGNYGTPFNAASAKGELDVCLALLRHGADTDALDSEGLSPPHRALINCHRSSVRLLLRCQEDVDIQTDW